VSNAQANGRGPIVLVSNVRRTLEVRRTFPSRTFTIRVHSRSFAVTPPTCDAPREVRRTFPIRVHSRSFAVTPPTCDAPWRCVARSPFAMQENADAAHGNPERRQHRKAQMTRRGLCTTYPIE